MNDEQAPVDNPIGLYHDPASGQYLGANDPIQADAMKMQGWELFAEGREAAMTSQEDIDALIAGKTEATGGETYEPANKKGTK